MPSPVEQGWRLLGFNEWANDCILSAAEGLSAGQFSELSGQFTHMLSTQRWWYRKWTGAEYDHVATHNAAVTGVHGAHTADGAVGPGGAG